MLKSSSLLRIAPSELLCEERLDIVIKHQYISSVVAGNPDDRLYRWHILNRTGGKEKRGSNWKRTVDDYVRGVDQLVDSMGKHGFKSEHPVEFGSNARLRDGAHRIACALLLKLDVPVVVVESLGRAAPWGENWLVQHGISNNDLLKVKADYQCLKKL